MNDYLKSLIVSMRVYFSGVGLLFVLPMIMVLLFLYVCFRIDNIEDGMNEMKHVVDNVNYWNNRHGNIMLKDTGICEVENGGKIWMLVDMSKELMDVHGPTEVEMDVDESDVNETDIGDMLTSERESELNN